MNGCWETRCGETPCCSFAKTQWKLPGPLLTPFSGIQHLWRNTNRAHGDLMRPVRLADDVGGWHDPEGCEADKVAAPRAA
jgi:hypothetical protein